MTTKPEKAPKERNLSESPESRQPISFEEALRRMVNAPPQHKPAKKPVKAAKK